MIAGAILGLLFGVDSGYSLWQILPFALLFAMFGVIVYLIIAFLVTFVEGLVVWIKARIAKSNAYYMIESCKIYSEQFQKVISALERWNDREARHLLNDLHELEQKLEQIPDNAEEEDNDKDKDSLLKAMSITELEKFKAVYKTNESIVKILDGYINAKRKATK